MKKYKYLVTGGCSFTANTWPVILGKQISTVVHDYANSGLSNDVIAPSVVYGVERLLNNGVSPDDILVGIMWSGVDRKSFFKRTLTDPQFDNPNNYDTWKENYTFIIKDFHPIDKDINPTDCSIKDYSHGCYSVQNFSYDTQDAIAWYHSCLYDPFASRLKTLEKIIWLQCFLKEKNIDYFMSTFRNSVLEVDALDNHGTDPYDHTETHNINLSWMFKMLDKKYFLPIRSFQSIFTGDDPWRHPLPEEDDKLVLEFIIPFIEKNFPN